MILVCAVTIAQTSISLLPKPQLYKDTGKNFKMCIRDRLWIDERIDGLVSNNPQLKVASVYLKRGAKNFLAKQKDGIGDMIDNARCV